MTRQLEYQETILDWVAQWILITLRDSSQYHSAQSLCREYNEFEAVTESKIRRRLRKLENAGLVSVDTQRVAPNVNEKKFYRLSDDGRYYVREMEGRLAQPPQHTQSEMLQYLKQETDALEHYVKQLIENAEEDTIEPW